MKDHTPRKPYPKMWEEGESNKKKSDKHEARLAKKLRFRQTVNSGALPSCWQKEDGFDEQFVYQLKRTEGKDCRIVSVEALALVTQRAYEQGKEPVMVVTLTQAKSPTPRDWVMIPDSLWQEMKDAKEAIE